MASIHQESFRHVPDGLVEFQKFKTSDGREVLVIWWHDDRSNSIEIALNELEIARLKTVMERSAE